MMAHVAEASEDSGRVLFWLDPNLRAELAAIDGASRLAAAFGSEIETLVVNDGALPRALDLPVSRVIDGVSGNGDHLSDQDTARVLDLIGERQRRDIETYAGKFGVPCHHTITAGEAIDQLTGMCLMSGPWNVIALAHAPTAATAATISAIMANVSGATAVVVAARTALRSFGPVAVVAEDCERLPSMLRAAMRLKQPGALVHVFLAADTFANLRELEAQTRILTSERDDLVFETSEPTFALEGTFDERLRSLAPSYVIARFGGNLLPSAKSLPRTVSLAGAPFLLVR